jgi:hypothetical protein
MTSILSNVQALSYSQTKLQMSARKDSQNTPVQRFSLTAYVYDTKLFSAKTVSVWPFLVWWVIFSLTTQMNPPRIERIERTR